MSGRHPDDEVVAVTFKRQCLSYFVGETAWFRPDHAQALIDNGEADAVPPPEEPPPEEPPPEETVRGGAG
jgi:hypothetical protein